MAVSDYHEIGKIVLWRGDGYASVGHIYEWREASIMLIRKWRGWSVGLLGVQIGTHRYELITLHFARLEPAISLLDFTIGYDRVNHAAWFGLPSWITDNLPRLVGEGYWELKMPRLKRGEVVVEE